ncbi:endonuclease MutS2 [Erysipelothrix sp. HDW6C]|uniref:endonuclease MutS2 n=1 Tax=Erysipelothrix sp. HDW6C TaxID=2714930 RepID=UPI0014085793|nr:endonuclease MutS2 [Erysipelothrix sp. HDW6C]QIK69882.1 endonuclease MutS2 [Erysipelothrix sp. HDW6C]
MNNISSRLEFDKVLERIAFHASFSLGKERVLETEPSFSALIVRRDLARAKDALQLVITNGGVSFAGITDVSYPLGFAGKGGVLGVDEIVDVGRFLQGIERLKKQFKTVEGSYPALEDLFESLVINESLLKHIEHAFGEQGEVLDRASSELSSIRRSISSLEANIEKQTQDFLVKNKAMLSEAVVSLQHGRKTFLIKPSEKNKMDGTIYGESASGQSIYFEPAFLSRLQNELQSLRHREADEIERICREASMRIAEDADQLEADLETVAILDAIFAKAEWGKRNDAVVATLTTDTLKLVKARHPLIDPKTVVANTYELSPPHKMILISGPNTGGKSVSLKTIGLSLMLALSGCPICAEEAQVMLVDQIFVDIGDQQSIEKSLSSFSAHMQTMTTVSERATAKSIVLLDELGSQTDPLEGESLSMAILDHFREVGCWVVATTHFSRLKKYGTQHDNILIASVEFDLQNLKPTYRYRENIMGESNAFAIAKRLGLNGDIIDQAFKYKQEGQYEADHLLEILETKIKEQDDLKEALNRREQEIADMRESVEVERVQLEREFVQKREQMIEENEQYLETMLQEAEKQLEVLNKTNRPDVRQKAVKEIQSMQREIVDETIKVGDRVQLKSTNQVGVVDSIEKKTAYVTIGSLKVSVDLNKLTRVAGPAKKVKPKPQRSHSVSAHSSFKTELNLIGMRVAEAIPQIDKFIDDAIVNKVYQFRIIHGHGTGQLRNAVHDRLRRNKSVASFELGSLGEGGTGATVVKLKQ